MKILVCLVLWTILIQYTLTEDDGSGYKEVLFKPRRKSAKVSLSEVEEICKNVSCSSNQVCEIYEYEGNGYPICYAKELLLELASACSIVNVCLNGGSCLDNRCRCLPGGHGVLCETNFTMCAPVTNPCKDDELCVTVSGGGARCQSRPVGFIETTTKESQASSTTAVAKSKDLTGYSAAASTDSNLLIEDACLENRCRGPHCRCVLSCKHEKGYYCVSDLGYVGQYCEIAPPTLECAALGISVGVSMKFVEEYEGEMTSSTLFVSAAVNEGSSSKCVAIRRGNSLVVNIPAPFTTCGNLVTESTGEMIYSSTLWVNYHENQTYDMPKPVLDFNCTYETEFIASTNLKPVVDKIFPSRSAMVHGKLSASLCKVSVCDAKCPAHLTVTEGATYTVTEILHLGLTVSSPSENEQSAFVTEIDEAFLSCSNDENEDGKVNLVKGCQDGNDLYAQIGRRSKLSTCMSFRVPKMSGCSVVYIHFKVFWCLESNIQDTICPNGRTYRKCGGIQKRSLVHNLDNEHHVFGPIEIVKSWKEVTLKFPDNFATVFDDTEHQDAEANSIKNSNDDWIWYVVIGCAIGLSIVVLLSFAVFSIKNC